MYLFTNHDDNLTRKIQDDTKTMCGSTDTLHVGIRYRGK